MQKAFPEQIEAQSRLMELAEAEHRQRMEYAQIEHERRMEAIEAEAILADIQCRRLADQIMPGPDRLRKLIGTCDAPPNTFGEGEEMPY